MNPFFQAVPSSSADYYVENVRQPVNRAILPTENTRIPAQYIDKSIMPDVETAAQMNNRYNGSYYQNFKDNYPMTPREFNMANQIYGQKLNYEMAKDAYDKETDNGKRANWQATMNNASNSADMLRNIAKNLGYDVSATEADKTLTQATQNMESARLRGMNELADMPSTAKQARDLYYDMRAQGKGTAESRAVANYMFDEMRENNIRKLMEGIGTYGVNADGSLNDFGQMMLYKLAPESPTAANVYANGYAMPRDVYQTSANFALNMANNDAAWQRNSANIQSANELATAKSAQEEQHHQDKLGYDYARLQADIDYRNAQIKAQTENLANQRKYGSPEAQAQEWYKFAKMFGQSDEAAREFAFNATTASLKLKNGDENTLNEKIQIERSLSNQLVSVRHALEEGDSAKAVELLQGLDDMISNPEFKGLGLIDEEGMSAMRNAISLYTKVANKELTLEEVEKIGGKSGYKGGHDQALNEEMNQPNHQSKIDTAIEERESRRRTAEKMNDLLNNAVDVGRGSYFVINPESKERQYTVTPKSYVDSLGRPIIIR